MPPVDPTVAPDMMRRSEIVKNLEKLIKKRYIEAFKRGIASMKVCCCPPCPTPPPHPSTAAALAATLAATLAAVAALRAGQDEVQR